MNYTMGSLFDGSGGFPLAGSLCDITPKWASEVEPYPIAVTRSRFPDMKHLGDISKINGAEIEPVDIISCGSPCQDLSLAGKRAGLKHEANGDEETTRSGLFMEAVRIIKEMRDATNGKYPRFALWENVPGAFSSNKGEDFRVVCEELIKIVEPAAVMPAVPKKGWPYADSYVGDGWSLAYRVFDAQYWGVPQRRRRIHLVADFRGERAREILFEREGVRGYFETGGTPWQETPGDAERSSGADDCEGECVAYSFDSLASNSMKSKNPHSGCRRVEIGKTLDTTDPNPSKNQGGIAIVEIVPYTLKIRSGCEGGGKGALIQEDKSATLATNSDQYLFQPITDTHILDDQGGRQISVRTDGKAPTLRAEMHGNVPCIMDSAQIFAVENHPGDSRVSIDENGKVQTLTSRIGTGGGNVPMVMEQKPVDRPAVAYTMQAFGSYKDCGVGSGLKARDYKDATDLVVESAGVDCRSINEYQELYPTLQAKPNGGWSLNFSGAVRVQYIARRLTPTECARLQGFADRWGDIDRKDSFTPVEYAFWLDVRNTHAAINGKQVKDYTEHQMLTWYNKLQTDSAEYKMWGNGIALPPALYCMQGITDVLNKEAKREEFTWETIEAMWS